MQTIKIKNEQCFLDLVLESTGTINNTLIMALANDVSITDDFSIGKEYKVAGPIQDSVISTYRMYPPATGYRAVEEVVKEGISYWAINKDFIVGV
ncbi:hypothetical protein [Myroides sp. TSA_177.3]|uniref:hypothetical protein n=1 Tax=Myroides sp. TSA_177.3 TaxID=3415650 RepID=UPI004045DCA5